MVVRIAHAATPPSLNDVYVILMVLDGCRPDRLDALLRRGTLPQLKRIFVDRGVRFTHALATFPSATSTNYQAMISGLYPGHAGMPYLEWLQREPAQIVRFLAPGGHRAVNRSFRNLFAPEQGTLFDDLAPLPTAAIYAMIQRNAHIQRPHYPPIAALWATFVQHNPERLNALAMDEVLRRFEAANEPIPRFTFVGLLTTDMLTHHYGIHAPQLDIALQEFDGLFGQLTQRLRERGILDRTYLIITADHGMHDIHGMIDLPERLRQLGLRVAPSAPLAHADVYVGARGVSVATLTARGPHGWRTPISLAGLHDFRGRGRQSIDLIDTLRRMPEIDLVLARGSSHRHGDGFEQQIHVYRREQQGLLRSVRRGGMTRYGYRAVPNDPLDLQHHAILRPLTDGTLLTTSAWQSRLVGTETPLVVPHLAHIFDDGRAGDLVIIAKPDWGFYRDKHATHGSHHRDDVAVPLFIHGPGIRPGQRRFAQLVDLYPTIRRWFGLPALTNRIDGVPLFE